MIQFAYLPSHLVSFPVQYWNCCLKSIAVLCCFNEFLPSPLFCGFCRTGWEKKIFFPTYPLGCHSGKYHRKQKNWLNKYSGSKKEPTRFCGGGCSKEIGAFSVFLLSLRKRVGNPAASSAVLQTVFHSKEFYKTVEWKYRSKW